LRDSRISSTQYPFGSAVWLLSLANPQILSDDFSKLVFLRTDRTIEFHAKFGHYYKTRLPKVRHDPQNFFGPDWSLTTGQCLQFGRDIAYHFPTCDLYTVGVTNEIYRLNLEQGRFLKPLESACPAINVRTPSAVMWSLLTLCDRSAVSTQLMDISE